MASLLPSLNSFAPSTLQKPYIPRSRTSCHQYLLRGVSSNRFRCRASSASSRSSASWVTDFDLYELLGVDRFAKQSEIKKAYRGLQKRCHPDIAGEAGHDMAILLNEIYALLSDPISRYAYDQEQVRLSEFQGYTGKPLYSTWCGSQSEKRAVFVDEVKCIGCLKCALFAKNTFAIESVYGRARVVAQWADPEEKVFDAIQTCPVDCISIIEKSDLPALEFLMSKQPRGNIRISVGNTVGERVSNIFAEVSKFQSRFHEMKNKTINKDSKDDDLQRVSRFSAVQGIRSISNWLYWRPSSATVRTENSLVLTITSKRPRELNIGRLKEAAARRRTEVSAGLGKQDSSSRHNDEYWTPMLTLPSPATSSSIPTPEPSPSFLSESRKNATTKEAVPITKEKLISKMVAPLAIAVVSATIVGLRFKEFDNGSILNEHIGGAIALQIVNSFEMQILLSAVTWFVIGAAFQNLFDAIKNNGGSPR